MAYEIQTQYGDHWSNEVGEPNVFDSEAEAETAIAGLRELDAEWPGAEYRVREITPI